MRPMPAGFVQIFKEQHRWPQAQECGHTSHYHGCTGGADRSRAGSARGRAGISSLSSDVTVAQGWGQFQFPCCPHLSSSSWHQTCTRDQHPGFHSDTSGPELPPQMNSPEAAITEAGAGLYGPKVPRSPGVQPLKRRDTK